MPIIKSNNLGPRHEGHHVQKQQEMRVPASTLCPILLGLPNHLAQALSLTSG
jgi:hypothetical protein